MTPSQGTEAAAFDALVDQVGPRVYSLALRITGSYEQAEATTEEVLQQVWKQSGALDDPTITGRAGISRLAHGHAVRRARTERQATTGAANTARTQDRAPERGSHRSALLDRLTPEEAAALEVTYLQGRTLQQAAGILDHPVSVLTARLRSGLAKLSGSRLTDAP